MVRRFVSVPVLTFRPGRRLCCGAIGPHRAAPLNLTQPARGHTGGHVRLASMHFVFDRSKPTELACNLCV